jgi:hypothetical protein
MIVDTEQIYLESKGRRKTIVTGTITHVTF